ncbi:MAG: hypothetical protein KAI80_07025 [Hyphomicrobiaceae bacterium]|nr:hypothetical protein [Hyphomicrobiaceae bacterium]
MATWTTHHTVINGDNIRLDLLDQQGKTIGWVVRRACNVYQAYRPHPSPPDSGVVDLLRDGVLIGQAGDVHGARDLVQEALRLDDTNTNPVLRLEARPRHDKTPQL